MRFQNPFVINADDKAKLVAAKDVVADAFPSVSWKPGRKAIELIGKAIPTVSWEKADKPDSE